MFVHMCSSPDGAQVAVLRSDEVALYAASPLVEIARAQVEGHGGTVAFCGKQVLIHTIVGDRTLLTVLGPPKLGVIAQLELSMPTTLLAVTHGYALLGSTTGAVIAQCSATTAAVAALRLPATFDWAVGLEGPSFMTWGPRGAEIWDAATRRPSARIALVLPAGVRAMGNCSQQRSIWVATVQNELLVSRLSDGRTIPVRLPGPPERIASHPGSSWLIADIDGAPHMINVVTRTCERVDVPLDDGRVVVPSPRSESDALLVLVLGDEVVAAPISSDATVSAAELVPAAPPTKPVITTPAPEPVPVTVTMPETPPRFPVTLSTSNLSAPSSPGPERAAGVPRPMTVSERLAERSGRAVARPPETPAPASAPEPAPAPASAPVARPRPAAPATAGAASGWRTTLLDWYRGAPADPLPAVAGSPIAELAARGMLGGAAVRILHALYASWLDGLGDTGVAIARLAEVGAAGGATAWAEALGTGQLAALGMVTSEHGRTRLLPSLGTFLDGRRPRAVELLGNDEPPELPGGLFRIAAQAGETPRLCAERLARGLGQVGYLEADGQGLRAARQLADQGRFEAWLRRRAAITSIDLGAVSLRDGETVLLVVPAAALDVPGGPPWWRDAAS